MIPLEAVKRAGNASNSALTGDIYTRRWQSKPRKKGQAPVEHELRVNPLSLALGAVAVGTTALVGAAALWVTQQKLGKAVGKDVRVDVVVKLKDGDEVLYTYSMSGVPFKVSKTGIPFDKLLPAYYIRRGYAFSRSQMISTTATEKRGYVIYKTTQERYGIQERKGFGIDIGL